MRNLLRRQESRATDREHIPVFQRWVHKGLVRHLRDQLLLVEYWRRIHMRSRFLVLSRCGTHIRKYENTGSDVAENTVAHNLKGLLQDVAVVRSDALVKPLAVLECLEPNAQILCVGPRSEGEIFNLAAHGFKLENLRGLDLISYSPLIDLGDMHHMPYPDESWDAVVCGWVIAYSDNKPRAASELVRVCRPGGVIAVGVEYHPDSEDVIAARVGYYPGSGVRIATLDAMLDLFGNHVDTVYFSQEPTASHRDRKGSIVAIFSVKK